MPSYAEVAAAPNGHSNSHAASPDEHKKSLEQRGYELLGRAIAQHPAGKPYSTAIEEVPVTFERLPYVPGEDGEETLIDAGTARATIAASREAPNGTVEGGWARRNQNKTVVQQHVAYWDQDADGVIWPQDTYHGVRAWGWAIPLSLFVAWVIHFNLSYATAPGWLPDPFFRIWVARVHKDKHGSDSMTFDNEGRFKPQNFEDLFSKYDKGNKGGLDGWDLLRAWKGQRMAFDFFGWSAAFLEWLATYLLLWPADGILRKEDVRRVFDGSIFQHKADEYAEKQRRAKERKKSSWLRIRAKVL